MSDPIPTDQLSPVVLAEMIDMTLAGLPMRPGATPESVAQRREVARVSVMAYDPRTPREAMLASQIVLTQYAAMDCFRRLVEHEAPDVLRIRQYNNAAAMLRLSTSLLVELQRAQARRNAAARVARTAQPAAPQPAPRPTAPAAPAPRPQAQQINPTQSGKQSGTAAPPSNHLPGVVDPAVIAELARRAVAAASARPV